jgi:hypothetical protein
MDSSMTGKQIGIVLAAVFVAALAVVVALKMSAEAMAVIIGIVCGVAAGIPTSILLLVGINRRDQRRMEQMARQAGMGYRNGPPVVVIQGGTQHSLPQSTQAGYWPVPQPGAVTQRDFHIVGGDDLGQEGGHQWSDIGDWRIQDLGK